ncbi:hypothetical protein Srut_02860 [Streptomyces rutgersensis]|nr:hypothetical protein Srut_02860 [Streptomyces rutgersensis]
MAVAVLPGPGGGRSMGMSPRGAAADGVGAPGRGRFYRGVTAGRSVRSRAAGGKAERGRAGGPGKFTYQDEKRGARSCRGPVRGGDEAAPC